MKPLLLALAFLLTGCVSHVDSKGNYTGYSLHASQAAQVARNVTAELVKRYPARSVFTFAYECCDAFPIELEKAIRAAGMGISPVVTPGYNTLRYRLERLNDHQFFVVIIVNQNSFQTIWSDDDNALVRLKTITQFEVTHGNG